MDDTVKVADRLAAEVLAAQEAGTSFFGSSIAHYLVHLFLFSLHRFASLVYFVLLYRGGTTVEIGQKA